MGTLRKVMYPGHLEMLIMCCLPVSSKLFPFLSCMSGWNLCNSVAEEMKSGLSCKGKDKSGLSCVQQKLLHMKNKKALVKQKWGNVVGPNLQQVAFHVVHGSTTCRQKMSRKMLKQGLIIYIYTEKKML